MTLHDWQLIVAALVGIALSVVLIVKGRLHAFIALLCGAFTVGLLAGLAPADTAKAVQKGVSDILGGIGLVVALGLSLGAMLQLSNGAASLARSALRLTGQKGAPWASLLAAMVIGLPLFFETGLVLLLPIVAAAAASPQRGLNQDAVKLRLMLCALAGLSVVHALVPPHPGPLLAISALGANLSRTVLYGLIIAVPTAIIAGPVLSLFIARGVPLADQVIETPDALVDAPPLWRSLTVILMPVVLIGAGQVHDLAPPAVAAHLGWLTWGANPVIALLAANLAGLPLLFGPRMGDAKLQETLWADAMKPAGAILLSIGAGGALKQVLVSAGLSDLLARVASGGALSPILLAWLVAVCVRLSTGSATVATITTAGIMAKTVAATGASPEWIVLAIGGGSVFFSHLNDPGFWLVKNYLGTSTADTLRTWSVLETVLSVISLLAILCLSRFI